MAMASEPSFVAAVLPMAIELLPTFVADTPMATDSFWSFFAFLPIAIAPSAERPFNAFVPMEIPSWLLANVFAPQATEFAPPVPDWFKAA
ncbi:hypothetical protein [Neisseria blantyrii]|uniref:hypothetical protein n=1 Tax=Neisseria blantyrii TaxID=2830647 RepID=UPI0027296152|nr:hypothetical protein [Neisseria blantyrii]